MNRGAVIFLNIIVVLVFLAIFIAMEPLLLMAGQFIDVTPLVNMAIRYFVLIVIGFCIGNLTQVFTRTEYQKTFWDIKSFLLLSIIPFIFLLSISISPIVDLITRLPVVRESPTEFIYYLISARNIWLLWIGVNLGASIKFSQSYTPKRVKK